MPFPSDSNPDTEVLALLDREVERQTTGLQLIASENFTSPAVMAATRTCSNASSGMSSWRHAASTHEG